MAYPTIATTFTSGTTGSASEVNANFAACINGVSDGTKDIYVNNATFAGALDIAGGAQFTGAVTFSGVVQADSTVRFAGAVTHSAAAYFDSTSRFTGGATFSGAVYCNNTVRFSDTVTASAAINADSTLRVTGGATFSGAVYADNTLRVTGGATFSGAVYAASTVTFAGGITGSSATFTADVDLKSLRINGGAAITTSTAGAFNYMLSGSVGTAFSGSAYYQVIDNLVSVVFGASTVTATAASGQYSIVGTFPVDVCPIATMLAAIPDYSNSKEIKTLILRPSGEEWTVYNPTTFGTGTILGWPVPVSMVYHRL